MARGVPALALLLALAKLPPPAAAATGDVCYDPTNFVGTNIKQRSCITTVSDAAECSSSCYFTASSNQCLCSDVASQAECEALDGYVYYYEITCEDASLPESATNCSDSSYGYMRYTNAEACCSDGKPMCADYFINPCANPDAFDGDLTYYQYCIIDGPTDYSTCNTACTSLSGSSYSSQYSSYWGNCQCYDMPDGDCASAGGEHSLYTCEYAQAVSWWGDLFTAPDLCDGTYRWSIASAGLKCCTDNEPLCEASYYDDDDDDDFTVEDDLCYNGDFDSSAALTSCYQTFATQAELDAANCPSSCSSGYAGGPDPLTETEAAYTYEATGGWCKSPLDAQVLNDRVGFFSADQCWDACVEEFGIDVIDNVEYGCVNVVDSNLLPFSFSYDEADIDGCSCYCQSSCGCIAESPSSTLFKSDGWDSVVPEACSYSYYDDIISAENGLSQDPFYFCSCDNTGEMTASECEARLGTGASFLSSECSDQSQGLSTYMLEMCDDGNYDYSDRVVSVASICCSSGVASACMGEGYCYAGTSMATVLRDGKSTSVKLSEVKVGDMALAAGGKHGKAPSYIKITGMPHSKSHGNFVVVKAGGHEARVTPHHTFPTCDRKHPHVAAKDIKVGDCLRTATDIAATSMVQSVKTVAAQPWDETFSVELDGDADVLVLGGILTHANPPVLQAKKKALTAKSRAQKVRGHEQSAFSSRPPVAEAKAANVFTRANLATAEAMAESKMKMAMGAHKQAQKHAIMPPSHRAAEEARLAQGGGVLASKEDLKGEKFKKNKAGASKKE